MNGRMNGRRVLHTSWYVSAALVLGLWSFAIPLTMQAAEKPFFEGKTIRIITGFSPGGGTDLRARLFARHMAKYIPGKPTIIVQIMTGAGGIVAANYTLGGVAKPDGLSILHFPSSPVMNVFLLKGKAKYGHGVEGREFARSGLSGRRCLARGRSPGAGCHLEAGL